MPHEQYYKIKFSNLEKDEANPEYNRSLTIKKIKECNSLYQQTKQENVI